MGNPARDVPIARPIGTPAGEVSRPQLLSSKLVVFHDAGTVWVYTTEGQRAWSIKARTGVGIRGIAISGDGLYVVDGHVLSQYASDTLHSGDVKYPSNAVAIGLRDLTPWAAEDGDPAAFDKLFAGTSPWLSPPLCDGDGNVHVLQNDGTLYSFPENLDTRIGSYRLTRTNFVPDELKLHLAPSQNEPRICWISQKKIAVAETGELESPPDGILNWRWRCIAVLAEQPCYAFVNPTSSIRNDVWAWAVRFSYRGVPSVMLFQKSMPGLTCTLITPCVLPKIWNAGELDAAGAGKVPIFVGNPWNPLVKTFPPEHQAISQGTFTVHGKQDALSLAALPCVADEPEGPAAYVVLYTNPTLGNPVPAYYFAKIRLAAPVPNTDWTMQWWQAIYRTVDALRGWFATTEYSYTYPTADDRFAPHYAIGDLSHYGAPPAPIDGKFDDVLWNDLSPWLPALGLADVPNGPRTSPFDEWLVAGRVIFASDDRLIPVTVIPPKIHG